MKKEKGSISSPNELDKYLQHSYPLTWVILGIVTALLIAFFVWSAVYKLEIKLTGNALVSGGEATLEVDDASLDKLKEGQKVYVSNQEGLLSFNDEHKPIVYNISLSDGEYTYSVIIGEKHPFDFLIGQ